MIQSRLGVLIAEKEMREGRKWTYDNIHEATGLSTPTIHRLVRGTARRYDSNTLDALCRFFDCGVGDLLVYVPDEPNSEEPA